MTSTSEFGKALTGVDIASTVHDGAATVPAVGFARRTGLLVWPTRRPYHDLRPFRDSEKNLPDSSSSAT
jgi:hypothetical protein